MAPPAAGDTQPPSPTAESTEESQWLEALSEPELDLLISLKMLAVKRAETAGRPHLADALDLRTLRALGVLPHHQIDTTYSVFKLASDKSVVLLEDFKQRLREETSLDATGLDRLVLSRDPVMDASVTGNTSSDSEVFRRRSQDQAIEPSGAKKKRKQTHDGCHEVAQRNKKRRKTSERRYRRS